MKAIVLKKYGSPDNLKLMDVPKPSPKPNEVLIKVRATAINDWDWQILCATPFANRMMFGLFKPNLQILGCDVAGIVEIVGNAVSKFKPGDEVYGDLSKCRFGGFAEYTCADENALVHKPETMTFEEAAAIPQAGMLAVQGLIDIGKITDGLKILVNGAGGGVGTFAVQLSKLHKVEITGVDSAEKQEMMLANGYDYVIDYHKEDFTKTGKQYHLILDNKTNRSMSSYSRSLLQGGKYVTTGGDTGKLLSIMLFGSLFSKIYKKEMKLVMLKPNKDLAYINELFEAGKIKPIIDGHYKLEQTSEAFKYFGAGHHKGKLVISID